MRISDWSSDVCSSDLLLAPDLAVAEAGQADGLRRRKQPDPADTHCSGRRAGCIRASRGCGSDYPDNSEVRRPQAHDPHRPTEAADGADRKSVGSGKRVSVRVVTGGRRFIKKKKK